MKSPAVGLRVASVLFGVGAVVHAVRLAVHFNVTIGDQPLPLWGSLVGVVVAGFLCGWLWRLSCLVNHPLAGH